MSFSSLKKSNFADLLSKAESLNKTESNRGPDERLWKPEVDKAGNGYAVIRFLPAPEGEDLPWAQVWSHAFQGPGGWYIENSLTTLGKKDPVGELNRELWNSGADSDKEIARKQKRKLSYYSNIYVVRDPKNPENEGKVFLYRYGKKIFDKIMASMQPEFQDEKPVNVFDFWEGANFALKIKQVGGFWNYDSSLFQAPTALSADDAELEHIYNSMHSLSAFTADSEFKSYDDLETRLGAALGAPKTVQRAQEEEEYEPVAYEAPARRETGGFNDSDITPKASSSVDDDDDALSYFARLAED